MNHPHDNVILLTDCLAKIDKAEIVSFDIFDTLLLRRTAQPHDLFWFIEPKAREYFNDPMLDFYTARMQAERSARDQAYANGREEVTLDEIYEQLSCKLHLVEESAIEKVKHIELEIEKQHCIPHQVVKPLYEYAITQSKRVIFTSDMYLPEEHVVEMLSHNGYDKFEQLFLSSTIGKTKHQGSLYGHIEETMGIKGKDILHIGDNIYADIKRGNRAGFKTYHIEKPITNLFAHEYIKDVWNENPEIESPEISALLGTLANHAALYRSKEANAFNPPTMDWEHFGYYVVGPLYLGFTTWLLQESKAMGIDRLLFLARDGKIMKEAFELLQPYYGNTCKTAYLQVSRRALNIPRLRDGLDSAGLDYLTITDLANPLPISAYMERNHLGLTEDMYLPVIKRHGFDHPDMLVDSEEAIQRLRDAFMDLSEPIKQKAQREYDALINHIKEEGVPTDNKEKRAIVDVGWHGTMLYALRDLLGADRDNLGALFFGSMKEVDRVKRAGFPIYSYMVDAQHPEYFFNVLKSCIEIVELLFTAPSGSVLYHEEQGKIVVDKTENHPRRLEAVRRMQEGALQFLGDIAPLLETRPLHTFRREDVIKPLQTLLLNPTPEETGLFDDITHIQNIGTHDLKRAIAPPPNLKWLYFNPGRFAEQYRASYWRKGFETRMGTISLRYFKLLANTAIALKRIRKRPS